MNRLFDLTGKVALVTGGSRGIGRAISLALAAHGAKVAVNYASNAAAADETVAAHRRGRAIALAGDVADPATAAALVEGTIAAFGRIDILVNNAGVTADDLILRMSEDEWDRVIDTNLKGTFLVTKAALRPMVRQRCGRIISVSSVAGIVGNAGQANYSAAKAGIIGFTKAIAKEVASRNITANVIAPGFIDTEMTADLTDAQREEIMRMVAVGPHGHAGGRRAGGRLPRLRRGGVRHRARADRRRRTGDVLMAANPRRKARIAALQALYEADMSQSRRARRRSIGWCAEESLTDAPGELRARARGGRDRAARARSTTSSGRRRRSGPSSS